VHCDVGLVGEVAKLVAISLLEHVFGYPTAVGTWHEADLGRPIAAPLERCAELLCVDLATVRELATNIEPYIRADGIKGLEPDAA
jgi:hypothetical protein